MLWRFASTGSAWHAAQVRGRFRWYVGARGSDLASSAWAAPWHDRQGAGPGAPPRPTAPVGALGERGLHLVVAVGAAHPGEPLVGGRRRPVAGDALERAVRGGPERPAVPEERGGGAARGGLPPSGAGGGG